MKRTIINKVKDCKLKSITDFEEFQGNLKNLSSEAKQKLKQSIVNNGFTAPIFVWQQKVLDGHQRLECVRSLLEDGYELPSMSLPYVEIEADNEKQAKKILLTMASSYAQITNKGLEEYLTAADLNLEEIKLELELPELNLSIEEPKLTNEELGSKEVKDYTITIICKDNNHKKETIEFLTKRGYELKGIN